MAPQSRRAIRRSERSVEPKEVRVWRNKTGGEFALLSQAEIGAAPTLPRGTPSVAGKCCRENDAEFKRYKIQQRPPDTSGAGSYTQGGFDGGRL